MSTDVDDFLALKASRCELIFSCPVIIAVSFVIMLMPSK